MESDWAQTDTLVSVDPLGGGEAFSAKVTLLDPIHDLAVLLTSSPVLAVSAPLAETDRVGCAPR